MSNFFKFSFISFFLATTIMMSCSKDDDGGEISKEFIELESALAGNTSIVGSNAKIADNSDINLKFSKAVNPSSTGEITLKDNSGQYLELEFTLLDNDKTVNIEPVMPFQEGQSFTLSISNKFEGSQGERFSGVEFKFEIIKAALTIVSLQNNGKSLEPIVRNLDIPLQPIFKLILNQDIPANTLQQRLVLSGDKNYILNVVKTAEANYDITTTEPLKYLTKFNLQFPASLGDDVDRPFQAANYLFYSEVDHTPKFPVVSDDELLDLIQAQNFKFFWDFGHPVSGLARDRQTSGNTVTSGGSGFGLMAIIVAIERGFVTRAEGISRLETIINFLKDKSERFHGAWPHWLNGTTGAVVPFSPDDNGGDLVETSYLVMGLLTVRQYLDPNSPQEQTMIDNINQLWEEVEWDWYRKSGQNVLYWHWSPNFGWVKNHRIQGYNEALITYILAASSPTHSIPEVVYNVGWARNGDMVSGKTFYDIVLPLGFDFGGPLFFEQYTFLGINPTNLSDQYANYWEQCVNHTLINRKHCIENPKNFAGYSEECWGLTASDNQNGYSAHSPTNDLGVITPTAALSSFPFTPDESMDALHFFYYSMGDRLWGEYGFYDAFNPTVGWTADSFLAIDQGPIIGMIENYRTGLLWDLFMSCPEVQQGLTKLGFTF